MRSEFSGVPGDSSDLAYDPWLRLPTRTFPTSPGPLLPKSAPPATWVFTQEGLAGIAAGVVVAAGLALVARYGRTQPPDLG